MCSLRASIVPHYPSLNHHQKPKMDEQKCQNFTVFFSINDLPCPGSWPKFKSVWVEWSICISYSPCAFSVCLFYTHHMVVIKPCILHQLAVLLPKESLGIFNFNSFNLSKFLLLPNFNPFHIEMCTSRVCHMKTTSSHSLFSGPSILHDILGHLNLKNPSV